MSTRGAAHPPQRAPAIGRWLRACVAACAALVLAALWCPPTLAAELQVDEGVVVKFGPGAQLVVRDRLTTGPGITLTSLKDDTWGGQVASVAQVGAPGDWRGLRIEKTASAIGGATLQGASIRYAGQAHWNMAGNGLAIRGVTLNLRFVQVSDSINGLRVESAGAVQVEGVSLVRNERGLQSDGSATTVTGSRIAGNSTAGAVNLTPNTAVNAQGNWWGQANGPRDPVGNPLGTGDAVSAGVNYSGYLGADLILNPTVRRAVPTAFVEQPTVALEVSAFGATDYVVFEGTSYGGQPFTALNDGRAQALLNLSAGDGRKTITARFRNAAGATVDVALPNGVLLDTQVPTLDVSQPQEGAVISQPSSVNATASDASGIARVEFYFDNQLRGTETQPPFTLAWDPAQATEGAHVWRVVAVDEAGRSTTITRNITVARGQVSDTEGPTITEPRLGGATLADGLVIARAGTVSARIVDPSGVARVNLLLDGNVVATATESQPGTFAATLDITAVPNGAHVLALRAQDSLGNARLASFNVTVAHAAPDAPVITQPINGLVTRTPQQQVVGTAVVGTSVQLLLNGQPAGTTVAAPPDGRFSGTVTLVGGANQIQATATDAYGTSAPSPAVNVTLDLTLPGAPGTLAATGMPQGMVRLSWLRSSDTATVGYAVYRSGTPFTDVAAATRLNANGPVTATGYDDMPPSDGTWYYRVVSVNAAGAQSVPGNQAQAVADNVLPRALSIAYAPQGRVDAASGRIGQGRVNVVLTTNEALQTAPYLAIVPAGGSPITVPLTASGATSYSGFFTIDASTPSGTATVAFSARDLVGNRGTDVDAGTTLRIDTAGPDLTGIALNPPAPIRNDGAPTLQATFSFSKATATAPQISYLLSGPVRSPVPLTGLSQTSPTAWQASFRLPADAGVPQPEQLSFSVQAKDDLDNVSTRVTAPNQFQVFQGNLPPLAVPQGFSAKALPGGRVRLAWLAVPEAAAYQLYRQGPGQSSPQPLTRSTGVELVDTVPADGAYRYAVASVRIANNLEATSGPSAAVDVQASATAPGAPQNLSLQLSGQGIVAQWQPPLGSSVASYNLYRASGTRITSIQGLTPYKIGITANLTLDSNPSATESAYVVTALDAAGNESAISNSAYLNATLLPVTNVRVEQIGSNLPTLSWNAPSGNAAGYLVYVGPDAARIKITPSPIGSLGLTDTGYSSGERRYTIASVDATGFEMPRVVLLPSVAVQVASGLPLQRGVFNKLQVQVANLSTSAVTGARVVVRVPVSRDGTQFAEHRSDAFSLGSNQTLLVPVVVAGQADMPSQAAAQIGVDVAAHEGELVRVLRSQTLDVVDGALVVGIATEDFTRGGTGKLRLTVENTGEVDVELLTATNGGNDASSELRLKLLDGDGNVLATQAFKQTVGAGLVTLPNGLTVARIPAGQQYTSDVFSMNVPGASPSAVRVRLEVDKLRYHSGQADEMAVAGRGSERTVSLIDTAYFGEVSDVSPVISYGDQDVIISGRAVDRATGAALPNTRLKLVVNQQGFERSYVVLTDASGRFTYAFKPGLTDAGQYKVSALHPDLTDRPEQKAFAINRVAVGPSPYRLEVPRTVPFSIPFIARSGPGTTASALRFALNAASQPTGQLPVDINLQLPAPLDMAERQTASMPVTFTGGNSAQASGAVVLDVLSNERGSTPVGQVRVDYLLAEARPFLVSTPSLVETGLSQGSSQVETVTVQNNGLEAAANLRFTLSKPDGSAVPNWVQIASQADGTLAAGEKRTVDISFTPPAGTPEGQYEFRLHMQADNLARQSVNLYASLTQAGQGSVKFKASDIYTNTVDKQGHLIPGLAGASITVQNEDVPSITRELVTDAYGEAEATNLPTGRYKYRVRASNHQEAASRLVVKPGVTLNQPVFLDYTLIQVEWSVREVRIQDRYEITLNATFETDVPAPVVVMQPASVTLPRMNTGDVYYGELTITNYGLVRADNVQQQLPPPDAYFRYEFLGELPTTLEAKQRVTLPYRIVALQSLDAPANSGNATGGGCYAYRNGTGVTCEYTCANGVLSKVCGSSASWFAPPSLSCPAGNGGSSGGGGGGTGGTGGTVGWSWVGGGGGGGGPGSSSGGGSPNPVVTSPPATPLPGTPPCAATPNACPAPSSGGNRP